MLISRSEIFSTFIQLFNDVVLFCFINKENIPINMKNVSQLLKTLNKRFLSFSHLLLIDKC